MTSSLWTCPNCGRSFANVNQAHACQSTTVDEHLADKSGHAVAIYEEVVSALEDSGDFRIHPQRSRISFISRMTFGGVALAREWADLSFILPAPLDSDRVRKLELYGPTSWGHTVRLLSPADVDGEVRTWLGDALRRGNQETLDSKAQVDPIGGRQLEVFWTGFRGTVEAGVEGLWVKAPRHIAEALEAAGDMSIKIGRANVVSSLAYDETGTARIEVPVGEGLVEGDETDVFIKGL